MGLGHIDVKESVTNHVRIVVHAYKEERISVENVHLNIVQIRKLVGLVALYVAM